MPRLFREAIYYESCVVDPAKQHHRGAAAFHYFLAAAELQGRTWHVRFAVRQRLDGALEIYDQHPLSTGAGLAVQRKVGPAPHGGPHEGGRITHVDAGPAILMRDLFAGVKYRDEKIVVVKSEQRMVAAPELRAAPGQRRARPAMPEGRRLAGRCLHEWEIFSEVVEQEGGTPFYARGYDKLLARMEELLGRRDVPEEHRNAMEAVLRERGEMASGRERVAAHLNEADRVLVRRREMLDEVAAEGGLAKDRPGYDRWRADATRADEEAARILSDSTLEPHLSGIDLGRLRVQRTRRNVESWLRDDDWTLVPAVPEPAAEAPTRIAKTAAEKSALGLAPAARAVPAAPAPAPEPEEEQRSHGISL